LFANTKSKVVASIATLLLFLAASCEKSKTCDYEAGQLKDAQNKEAEFGKSFNANADSCLYFFGNQMPEGFRNNAYANLPENPARKDSVNTITLAADNVLPAIPESNPKYWVLKGISRTGGKALDLYPEYVSAQNSTKTAQTALTDCQAQL
jgi:hypothetical protein